MLHTINISTMIRKPEHCDNNGFNPNKRIRGFTKLKTEKCEELKRTASNLISNYYIFFQSYFLIEVSPALKSPQNKNKKGSNSLIIDKN